MTITLKIVDEMIPFLTPPGETLSRAALEALGLEAYRQRRLSGLPAPYPAWHFFPLGTGCFFERA